MSIMRCDKHDRRWDSDFHEQCQLCIEDKLRELQSEWEQSEQYSSPHGSWLQFVEENT